MKKKPNDNQGWRKLGASGAMLPPPDLEGTEKRIESELELELP